jgi:ParB-like nuclease domain
VRASEFIFDNFADGRGPGRPGDSQRHGIPKKATMAQLQKAAKAPVRKGHLDDLNQSELAKVKRYLEKQSVAEGKVNLYTDPSYFGAEVDDTGFNSLPAVNIPTNQLVGFEPDDKMNQPKSKANVEKIVAGVKKGDKLPPILVRKYKNGYQVLDGHHRFWAYKLLGVKSIPSRIVPDSDIEEIGKQSVTENFADGKGPGRPGDSQRHGIPKKATMAQLKKAARAKGRKGQLARWQINMRRGKKKHAKESIQETANNLSSIVSQDQVERNEYKKFVMSQANGDWENGAKMYAQLKKRPPDDIFGDKIRLSQFMKMQFEFNKFTEDDWNNYWLLAQHCDFNPAFQKKALDVIKQYQGENHSNYKYLYDRISCGTSGTQKYGTQDTCSKRG